MNRHSKHPLKGKQNAHPGMNIAEVLISLAVFSTAMVGLYMGINSLSQSVQEAMTRDIEAAYANMLLAQVNPYAIDVETAFDQTSRTAITLADGRQAYYTRIVDSDPLAGDIKRISVFLYHQASGGSPYRQFKREVPLNEQNYVLSWTGFPVTKPVYKDTTGTVWTLINLSSPNYVSTAGSYRAGVEPTLSGAYYGAGDPADTKTGIIDPYPWHYIFQQDNTAPRTIGFKFPATENATYRITLGFREQDAPVGARLIDISINGTKVTPTPIDVRSEAGGLLKPLIKSYTATPIVESGRAVITVQVSKAASSAQAPHVSWISLKKN